MSQENVEQRCSEENQIFEVDSQKSNCSGEVGHVGRNEVPTYQQIRNDLLKEAIYAVDGE